MQRNSNNSSRISSNLGSIILVQNSSNTGGANVKATLELLEEAVI